MGESEDFQCTLLRQGTIKLVVNVIVWQLGVQDFCDFSCPTEKNKLKSSSWYSLFFLFFLSANSLICQGQNCYLCFPCLCFRYFLCRDLLETKKKPSKQYLWPALDPFKKSQQELLQDFLKRSVLLMVTFRRSLQSLEGPSSIQRSFGTSCYPVLASWGVSAGFLWCQVRCPFLPKAKLVPNPTDPIASIVICKFAIC